MTLNDRYLSYKTNMENALGRELTEAEFGRLWEEQFNSFCIKKPDGSYAGRTDFAHMMYTIAGGVVADDAAGVASNFSPWPAGTTWTDHGGRRDYIGWLGDATWRGYPPTSTSFGAGDYTADLDADNIRRRMQGQNLSFMQASAEYYRVLQSTTRN